MNDIGEIAYKPYHIGIDDLPDTLAFLNLPATIEPDKCNGSEKSVQRVLDFNAKGKTIFCAVKYQLKNKYNYVVM